MLRPQADNIRTRGRAQVRLVPKHSSKAALVSFKDLINLRELIQFVNQMLAFEN